MARLDEEEAVDVVPHFSKGHEDSLAAIVRACYAGAPSLTEARNLAAMVLAGQVKALPTMHVELLVLRKKRMSCTVLRTR